MTSTIIDVIIPAYNEEKSITKVIHELPKNLVREIIVVNNNSTDATATAARDAGATVLLELQAGYGSACLKGMEHIADKIKPPDIVVFIDGDYSDYPGQLPEVIAPILEGKADIVIGSRAKGKSEKGSMTTPQVFGNWLATTLIKILYGASYSDLGPFRAIRYEALLQLKMCDTNYGWTVEMQIKAAKHKMKYAEVPVNYRKRIGVSKVSGTVKGLFGAGFKILYLVFKYTGRKV